MPYRYLVADCAGFYSPHRNRGEGQVQVSATGIPFSAGLRGGSLPWNGDGVKFLPHRDSAVRFTASCGGDSLEQRAIP